MELYISLRFKKKKHRQMRARGEVIEVRQDGGKRSGGRVNASCFLPHLISGSSRLVQQSQEINPIRAAAESERRC